VMVPKPFGSEALAAAVALPRTGGQYDAHVPLQLDFAGVSMANQYSVRPWALVSTVPIFVLRVAITTLRPAVVAGAEVEAGAVACAWGVVLGAPEPPAAELPQAAIITTAPAAAGTAHQLLRISVTSPFMVSEFRSSSLTT
jgi:hypothetical protein